MKPPTTYDDRYKPAMIGRREVLIAGADLAAVQFLSGIASGEQPTTTQHGVAVSPKLQVKIGQKTFAATLAENPATARLREMLPLTLEMSDLNANEKYHHLDAQLPTAETKPGTIRTGDLLLWGDNSLVLSYETFGSSYSYTRLGKLDDPTGLAEAVGLGSVTLTFETKR